MDFDPRAVELRVPRELGLDGLSLTFA